MNDTVLSTHPVCDAAATMIAEKARWPLSYCLQLPRAKSSALQAYGFGRDSAPRQWWSHELYRGPQNKEVEILYSNSKAQSELVAQQFMNEPILGFDMEWPWNDYKKQGLQNKVGLIQLASENKIALFHIGLISGTTTEDIIAPTLRRIIESPKIGKVGVHILQADFGRLNRFFGLKPQGAIEISHLYRLVKFGAHKPELVSVKLVSLAQQVEDQLGLPLYKGDVRTSNWSKPLSPDQIKYAASDAYAGFMLYHCTDAKRLAMKPTPPPPIYAERYPQGIPHSRDDPILLDTGGGTTTSTEEFFGVKPVKSGTTEAKTVKLRKTPVAKTTEIDHILEPLTRALFDELAKRRATLAESSNIPAWRVLSDKILVLLAQERPTDTVALLSVKGIGKCQQERYGDQWLEVISQFLTINGLGLSPNAPTTTHTTAVGEQAAASLAGASVPQKSRPKRAQRQTTPNSPRAFDTPPPRTPPQLHTGVSFAMAGTNLAAGTDDDISSLGSNETLPSLDFGSPSRETKRKRVESPKKHPASEEMVPPPQRSTTIGIGEVLIRQPNETTLPTAQCPTTAAEEWSTDARIARNKLLAFSKLVTRKLPSRPLDATPIVSDHVLDLIIRRRPRTQHDLERIPGIDGFLLACEQTGTDLLRNVIKFSPPEE